MKPLKLTMTAFGPYKDREVVDFTHLDENRLFVISGKTGAGKTTIFDGICFALYGSASGEDRENFKMLRSDFADDEVHTSVELVFELNGKTYRVLRQLGHVKKGNKTATGEKYEFYQITNQGEIPCVDRQMKSEIDQKVEEIVGLTKDQFSQIVMLPQGEFRKLLTSKTENKEEILRRIFQTYPYQEITERLNAKRKEVEDAFARIAQQRDNYVAEIRSKLPEREESKLVQVLSQEHFNMNQLVEALQEETNYYREQVDLKQTQKGQAQKHSQTIQDQYQTAKALNEKFKELAQNEQKLTELQAQKPEINQQQILLEKSERASQIEVQESYVKDLRQDLEQKRRAKADAEQAQATASEAQKQAEAQYKTEEKRKTEREEKAQLVERLKELRPKVNELSEHQKAVKQAESSMKELSNHYKSVEQQHQQQQKEQEQLEQHIRKSTEEVDVLPQKQKELESLREKGREAQSYIKLLDELQGIKTTLKTEESSYKKAKDTFEQKEQAWIHGQAGLLAQHLKDGEPCPVCGSLDHPQKAEVAIHTPTKEELDQAKAEYDKHYQSYTTVVAQFKAKQEQIQEKEQVLKNHEIEPETVKQTFDWIVEQGQSLSREVERLTQLSKELKSQREQLDKLTEQLKKSEQQKEQIKKQLDEKNLELERAKTTYQNALESVPETLREPVNLEKQLNEAIEVRERLEKAWESAQDELNKSRETAAKASTNVENARVNLKESQDKLDKAEQNFIESLSEHGFQNEEEYRNAKRAEEERKAMKDRIEQYNQQLATVNTRIKDLQEQLTDQERVDLESFEAKVKEAQEQYEQALQQYNQVVQLQQDTVDLKTRMIETSEQVAEQEKALNRVQDLYDVVRGQNNRKISFERYLQIEYLEQIVDAANARLKRLSNGQFYLKRSDRQEARGRQSGLGLDVYDVYTGQDRDVKTLSGGEKFNASLCLALGMSDVIQSFQGGVSIETMFIDEGFGSLDDESLNKAIDTLIDLQKSGRMIGLISHVQELKAAIPAVLEVNKSRDGYSETQFVLK